MNSTAMAVVADLLGLGFLMLVAYRGFSVILLAPVAAMIPVLLTHPSQVPAIFTGLYMEKTVYFVKLYLPLFLLGAVFGKLIELSGFARSIVTAVGRLIGPRHSVMAVVIVCALLTYGGVSLFVVVFAVYPFAAELFRQAAVPKRLIPATIALGAFGFSMDALPGSPQIPNIIPTTFFGTTAWAAPWLGLFGSAVMFTTGVLYLQWRVKQSAGEGYGEGHTNEPEPLPAEHTNPHWAIALLPLVTVEVCNKLFGVLIPKYFGPTVSVSLPGLDQPLTISVAAVTAIWSLEAALVVSVLLVIVLAFRRVAGCVAAGTRTAVNGALLAALNTGSEYGFGAVISALPGFMAVRDATNIIPTPLLNAAVTTTALAGITGSASGGLSIALAAMSGRFIAAANAAGIPLEVMHRVTSMAAGGMDELPHNGAVITVLAVTGLTHRQSYKDVFAISLLKTTAVFAVIAAYYATRHL